MKLDEAFNYKLREIWENYGIELGIKDRRALREYLVQVKERTLFEQTLESHLEKMRKIYKRSGLPFTKKCRQKIATVFNKRMPQEYSETDCNNAFNWLLMDKLGFERLNALKGMLNRENIRTIRSALTDIF